MPGVREILRHHWILGGFPLISGGQSIAEDSVTHLGRWFHLPRPLPDLPSCIISLPEPVQPRDRENPQILGKAKSRFFFLKSEGWNQSRWGRNEAKGYLEDFQIVFFKM